MSVIIYTYRDPYKLKENKELWREISSCPYFCVAQTLVNGLKAVYGAAFQIGRVTTVKNLTDALYEKWNGTACAVKQHADIDNIIVNSSDITGISRIELDNVKKSFLFNRDEVFTSIRTMFELKMEPQNIVEKYLTPEQRFIVSVYKKIRASEKVKDFWLEQGFTEEQINQAITKAMTTAKDNSSTKNEIEVETLDHIVIHGVHQFSPLLLRAIEEIAKYKKVILLINYQEQYKNIYQTWIDIYSAFDCEIQNFDGIEYYPVDVSAVCYDGNLLAHGMGKNNNSVTVKTLQQLSEKDLFTVWDFVIVDEVHKYLFSQSEYEKLHKISILAKNILLLSATPVQQKKEEYLDLLRLLLPQKYNSFSVEKFEKLIAKQSKIIQKTALILDDLGDFEEEINSLAESGENAHDSEECEELFDEIHEDLEEICDELDDDKLNELLQQIKYENDDLGVYAIKVIISYICSNYQIESNIIRNRRKILESTDEDVQLMASRDLVELTYLTDNEVNPYEQLSYNGFANWIIKGLESGILDVELDIKPLLSRFFSSPWAFYKQAKLSKMDESILDNIRKWLESEQFNVDHINDILDDPDKFADSYASRLVIVINALYDDFYDQKIVLFTNYAETFDVYQKALTKVFPEEEVSFFGTSMSTEEIELNAYRFQTQDECRIMLCDSTGGEGRNFQCADYIVHIDLPWDASAIEQRIGRLDRLERDMSRPVVYSIVVHTKDTFEEALFSFFKDGLKIFNHSLSGMEIIMKEINDEIISAINDDFKYGLFDRIPKIVELANTMRDAIRKEQNFDAAGFIYRPMYAELRRLIEYYSQNENALFASTMSNWASLAGFRGSEKKNGEITYSATSFSPKSAINSQLIPPRWNEYLNTAQNQFLMNGWITNMRL